MRFLERAGRPDPRGDSMIDPEVVVRVREAGPEIRVVEVRGALTAFADSAFMAGCNEAARDNPRAIVLDFAQLDYLNSSGLALLAILIRATLPGRRLAAVGLNDHYREILEVTRMSERIPLYATLEDALRAL